MFSAIATFTSCNFGQDRNSYLKSFGYLGSTSSPTPVLTGEITYEENAVEQPLSGVSVSIGTQNALTDEKGKFSLTLKPGVYNIAVHKSGYKDLELDGYNADSNERTHASIALFRGNDNTKFSVGKDKIKASNHLK